jgi:hypothetical protein
VKNCIRGWVILWCAVGSEISLFAEIKDRVPTNEAVRESSTSVVDLPVEATEGSDQTKQAEIEREFREHEESIEEIIEEEGPKEKKITFGGYVKTEAFWDTRQVFAARDGQQLFFPLKKRPDVNGNDIDANGSFNILAIQTRLNATIIGPDIAEAAVKSFIEGDFRGTSDATINTFQMRHSMIRLDWKRIGILMGQFFHPIFVEECNAGDRISFNTAQPYGPGTVRNPQLRIDYKFSRASRLILAAISEVGFLSTGPDGPSSRYIRNSKTPLLHAQLQWKVHDHVFGAGIDLRTLKPRLVSDKNYKVDEIIRSVSGIAYLALKFSKFIFKIEGTLASNAFGYDMLGGYGISSVNPVTDERTYTPLRNAGVWAEITRNAKKFKPGIFVGVVKNIGAPHNLAPVSSVPGATSLIDLIYGRGVDIDLLFKVSPRVLWSIKALDFGAELEFIRSYPGTILQDGKVACTDPVNDVRFMFAAFYYF